MQKPAQKKTAETTTKKTTPTTTADAKPTYYVPTAAAFVKSFGRMRGIRRAAA